MRTQSGKQAGERFSTLTAKLRTDAPRREKAPTNHTARGRPVDVQRNRELKLRREELALRRDELRVTIDNITVQVKTAAAEIEHRNWQARFEAKGSIEAQGYKGLGVI